MRRDKREKPEIYTAASLQLLPKENEKGFVAEESYIEISLEERKKEADKPLYLKRV